MAFLNVSYFVVGDPGNTLTGGSVSVNFQNSNPDTLLIWVTPSLPTTNLGSANSFVISGLSGGSYAFYLQDFSVPPEQSNVVSFYVSTGTCVSITNVVNTTCGLSNGEINAEVSFLYGTPLYNLYDSSNTLISQNQSGIFTDLPVGVYYVIGNDGGGVTGRSQNCIVKSSDPLEFDLYVVNNSSCTNNLGKVYVTNLTGTHPFTYTWSNGVTGQDFITGLTTGFYTVTITDYYGCSKSETILVDYDDPMGVGIITTTPPDCFSGNGIVNLTISGGTAPYYYSGSNGSTEISFLQEVTFTGLSPGNFSIEVTDAGFCKFTTSTFLVTPNSFVVNGVSLSQGRCGGTSGAIAVSLLNNGSPATYTYEILDPLGNLIQQSTTNALNNTFTSLSSNTYTIRVSDTNSGCVFEQNYTLTNNEPFNISTSTTGTTCNLSNGSIFVEVTQYGTNGLVPPFTVGISGPNVNTTTIISSSTTFSNLASGSYTISVTDGLSCTKTTTAFVDQSVNVDFIMVPISSPLQNQNSITTFITQGEPPFTINWISNNVNGQTTASVNNLSAGTYTLQIIDSNFCTRTKSVTITAPTFYSSAGTFTICSSVFGNISYQKKGVFQMLMDGFSQLTVGGEGCVLTSATFTAEVIVNGTSYTNLFYSTTNFSSIPSDNLFADTVKNILLSVYGVGDVQINYDNNTITIFTDCNLPGVILAGALIEINLIIDYGIACISADACCGIISEDGNVAPTGPNFCLIVESGNTGIADYKIVIETD